MRTIVLLFLAALSASCSENTRSTPTPTAPAPVATTPTVASVTVDGTSVAFGERGATSQFRAVVTLSDGTTEDRTTTATWQSDDPAVATVSAQGVVTAMSDGQTMINASVGAVRGGRPVSVRLPRRAADPAPGQRLPMPDIRSFVEQASAARPELIAQSCPTGRKYETNPWLDYIVDKLREVDTRWGYNAKPTRTARDNDGMPVVVAGDEVAYHFSGGPDEGSIDVYLIDILQNHCGPTPVVTYRVFTGEEPGRWTGAGRF